MGASNLNELIGLLLGAIFGAAVVLVVGGCVANNHMELHSAIIKHGAAYYHPETGEFTWKNAEQQDTNDAE